MSLKTNLAKSNIEQLLSQHYEKELQKRVGKVFQNMGKEVIKELEEYYNPGDMATTQLIDLILAPIHELHHEYYTTLSRYTLKEYDRSRKSAKRITGYARKIQNIRDNQRKKEISFKSTMPVNIPQVNASINKDQLFGTLASSEKDLMSRTYKFSESTLNRVDQDIHKIIKDGYKEGKGINTVRDSIQNRFNELKTWEAQRIARTEINTSHNMGIMQGYQDMGVEYIQWNAFIDERTRTSHEDLNGEIIPIGATFSNGLIHPGDPNGAAEEVINCRCVASPFIIPDGYIAPPGMVPFRETDLVKIEIEPLPTTKPVTPKPTTTPKPKPKPVTSQTKPLKKSTKIKGESLLKGTPKTTKGIDPENKRPSTIYTYENGFELVFNDNAQFTHEEIINHINSLPEPLRNLKDLKRITFKNHASKNVAGEYNPRTKEIRIYKGRDIDKEARLNTFNHELSHALDNQRGGGNIYGFSSVEKYEPIFKKDNELHKIKNERTGKTRTPKRFATDYAGRSWKTYKNRFNRAMKQWKKGSQLPELKPHNDMFVEDFAESTKLYLNPKTHAEFIKNYPNRAKYLKKIYGKPNFKKMKTMNAAINETKLAEQRIHN